MARGAVGGEEEAVSHVREIAPRQALVDAAAERRVEADARRRAAQLDEGVRAAGGGAVEEEEVGAEVHHLDVAALQVEGMEEVRWWWWWWIRWW